MKRSVDLGSNINMLNKSNTIKTKEGKEKKCICGLGLVESPSEKCWYCFNVKCPLYSKQQTEKKEAVGGGSEYCELSKRVDGKLHSWHFDGDDPYVICFYCGEVRDAVSGRKIK